MGRCGFCLLGPGPLPFPWPRGVHPMDQSAPHPICTLTVISRLPGLGSQKRRLGWHSEKEQEATWHGGSIGGLEARPGRGLAWAGWGFGQAPPFPAPL